MSTGVLDNSIDCPSEEAHELTPVLGEHWQLSLSCALMCAWFAIVFMLVNHTPLSGHHTWLHANNGSWVMRHGVVPTSLVGVPLADGIVSTSDSWLFDCFVFTVANRFGPEAISATNAILTSVTLWLWCGLIYRASSHVFFTLICAIAIAFTWSTGFASLHPRMVGALIMGAIVWVLLPSKPLARQTTRTSELDVKYRLGHADDTRPSNDASIGSLAVWRWLTIVLLFALWSNVGGAFPIGIGVLLSIAMGHVFSPWRANGFRAVLTSRRVQTSVWLVQLSALATLLSPHHFRNCQQIITARLDMFFGGMLEGRGLYVPSIAGLGVVALLSFSIWSLVRSNSIRDNSDVSMAEIFLLAFAFAATTMSAANVFWLVPLVLWVSARHWSTSPDGVASRHVETETQPPTASNPRPLKFAGTLLCGLAAWCGFALSPISAPILGGSERSRDQIFSAEVPVGVGAALRNLEHTAIDPVAFGWTSPSTPLLFAPANWADWLLWENDDLRVFANSQIRSMPRRIQADYQSVSRGTSGWDRILDRYAVGTLVIDKQNQRTLASEAMRHGDWRLVHESGTALVLQRVDRTRRST